MTRSPSPTLLAELQSPTSLSKLNVALVALKNELIGHEQRKKVWIGYGIVPILARILEQRKVDTGKRSARYSSEGSEASNATLSEGDSACIHAVVIAGNIAQAGASFVAPLLAAGIIHRLVFILSDTTCPSPLTLATLKTLNTLADRLPPQHPNDWPVDTQLAQALYARDCIPSLASILSQTSPSTATQQAISLTARLISKTCNTDAYKNAVVAGGVLQALAMRLASFVVAQGFVLPGAEGFVNEPGSLGTLPPSAPPKAQLAPIIHAIATLVDQSATRTEHLLSSPAIITVFPRQKGEFAPTDIKKAPWSQASPPSTWFSGSAVPQYPVSNPIDSLLPAIPGIPSRYTNANFPPLPSQNLPPRISNVRGLDLYEQYPNTESDSEDENAIVSWLIYLIRSDKSVTVRLRAAQILVNLFRLGLVRKERLPMLSMTVVPMLVGMLDHESVVGNETSEGDVLSLQLRIKEEVPHILANLMMDSQELQKAAVEANAIKTLAGLLKKSFDPLPELPNGMWSADKAPRTPRNRTEPELSLGIAGPTPMARHTMRFREGVLSAIASIAPFKDDYRKAICDQGVIPFIVDSLKPYTNVPHLSENGPNGLHTIPGNPSPTLLAACNAARALTRSVNVLRTSLTDANITPQIFTLLRNDDVEVQIASTRVVCNLALDFSPMKEAVIAHGVLKILCEHAHSQHGMLRLDSLWALKHLVYNSKEELRIKVLEELGVGWMMSILQADTAATANPSTSSGLINTNAFGEAIDVLNPKDSAGDISMGEAPINQGLENFRRHAAERRRAARVEPNPTSAAQTQRCNIAVQEQLLELIRNIICGNGASDMIDYLFREIGRAEFFAMLHDKLRPLTIIKPQTSSSPPPSSSSKMSTRSKSRNASLSHLQSSTTQQQQPTELLIATTFILIHLAASHPSHRHLLTMAQPPLLSYIIPLFNHSNRIIRVNCCWIAINLTYEDDASDKIGCRSRARELDRLGVLDRLRGLLEDPDLDVRERAKTGVTIFANLLGR